MKLLIVTQKIDATDSNLGFFVEWVLEFARNLEHVTVIANEVHPDAFGYMPKNVDLYSLGKESRVSRFARIRRYRKLLRSLLSKTDGVFFHMCPEYVLSAYPLITRRHVPSALWYTHRSVSLRLRLAEKLVSTIFTASRESCRLKSRKIHVVGHGINIDMIRMASAPAEGVHLVSVGRISRVKDVHILLQGYTELAKRIPEVTFSLIGAPLTKEDVVYEAGLRKEFPSTHFVGTVPQSELFTSDSFSVFIHASRTGSIDKAVLEALVAGLPVFTSSEAFDESIPGITKFEAGNPMDLADKVERAFREGRLVIGTEGRAYVARHHSLHALIPRLLTSLVPHSHGN